MYIFAFSHAIPRKYSTGELIELFEKKGDPGRLCWWARESFINNGYDEESPTLSISFGIGFTAAAAELVFHEN